MADSTERTPLERAGRDHVQVLAGTDPSTGARVYLFDLVTFDEDGIGRIIIADRHTLKDAITEAAELKADGYAVDWSAIEML